MKKFISLTTLVLALGAMPLLSHADSVCPGDLGAPASPGCVIVQIDQDNGNGSVQVDGAADNQDPLDGYVYVTGNSDGDVACYAGDEGNYQTDEDPATCQEVVENNLPPTP